MKRKIIKQIQQLREVF